MPCLLLHLVVAAVGGNTSLAAAVAAAAAAAAVVVEGSFHDRYLPRLPLEPLVLLPVRRLVCCLVLCQWLGTWAEGHYLGRSEDLSWVAAAADDVGIASHDWVKNKVASEVYSLDDCQREETSGHCWRLLRLLLPQGNMNPC